VLDIGMGHDLWECFVINLVNTPKKRMHEVMKPPSTRFSSLSILRTEGGSRVSIQTLFREMDIHIK
jgi:hypothetical protein